MVNDWQVMDFKKLFYYVQALHAITACSRFGDAWKSTRLEKSIKKPPLKFNGG